MGFAFHNRQTLHQVLILALQQGQTLVFLHVGALDVLLLGAAAIASSFPHRFGVIGVVNVIGVSLLAAIIVMDCQIIWQVNGGRTVRLLNNIEEVFRVFFTHR